MDNTEQRDFQEEAANRALLREEDNLVLPEDPVGLPCVGPEHSGPTVHIITSDSGQAYDLTQTSDDIRDGDVLIVPNEGIVAILYQAWPLALTSENGRLHSLRDSGWNLGNYEESVILAESYIRSTPYFATEKGQRVRKQMDTLDEDVLRERHNVHI